MRRLVPGLLVAAIVGGCSWFPDADMDAPSPSATVRPVGPTAPASPPPTGFASPIDAAVQRYAAIEIAYLAGRDDLGSELRATTWSMEAEQSFWTGVADITDAFIAELAAIRFPADAAARAGDVAMAAEELARYARDAARATSRATLRYAVGEAAAADNQRDIAMDALRQTLCSVWSGRGSPAPGFPPRSWCAG